MRALAALAMLALLALLAGCTMPGPATAPSTTAATTAGAAPTTTAPPTRAASTAPPPGPDPCAAVARAGLKISNASATVAAMGTDKGCIVLELHDGKAPVTVANFRAYAREGFFNGTLFHRITDGFMIQGGGMDTSGTFKAATHPPIKNEARSSGLKNVQYTIAMARTTHPDSATNQFFINDGTNANLDPGPNASDPGQAGYAVFGTVIQGREVVDAISSVPVRAYNAAGANPHCQPDAQPSCPDADVVIRSVRIL